MQPTAEDSDAVKLASLLDVRQLILVSRRQVTEQSRPQCSTYQRTYSWPKCCECWQRLLFDWCEATDSIVSKPEPTTLFS